MTGLLKGKIFFNAKFLYNGKKLLSQPKFLRAPVFSGQFVVSKLKISLNMVIYSPSPKPQPRLTLNLFKIINFQQFFTERFEILWFNYIYYRKHEDWYSLKKFNNRQNPSKAQLTKVRKNQKKATELQAFPPKILNVPFGFDFISV